MDLVKLPMREPEMFEPMIRYLRKQGYAILEVNRGKQQGPDILAEKAGRKIGDPDEGR